MSIDLSSQREPFVRFLMETGEFATENEVVEEALRLLEEHYEAAKLDKLRLEIAKGIEQADRGELEPFDPIATLARIRSERSIRSEKN